MKKTINIIEKFNYNEDIKFVNCYRKEFFINFYIHRSKMQEIFKIIKSTQFLQN